MDSMGEGWKLLDCGEKGILEIFKEITTLKKL